ncbi:MAG: hypothetical protein LBD64_08195, partial [Odoribacteraceae bacterium]|nr:hypothetical protein [Odoribacteraceae bacterium]
PASWRENGNPGEKSPAAGGKDFTRVKGLLPLAGRFHLSSDSTFLITRITEYHGSCSIAF